VKLGPVHLDGFLLALVAAIALAAWHPEFGASGSPLHLDRLVGISISIVFFLHGATLPTEALVRGARNWRLHLLVHGSTFVLIPLLGLAALIATRSFLPAGLALGVYYACVVPSTISSSVALVAVARGNVPAAVFNATLSGILGVFATPMLASFVADTAGIDLPLGDAIRSVALKVLVPLAVGQVARPLLAGWLGRHKKATQLADRGSIVLIVYGAFCESISAGVWSHADWIAIGAALVVMAAVLAAATALLTAARGVLGFSREDGIVAVFCGSQKSLASGMPVANVLFGGNPSLGLIVLPMILYHQMQLVLGAVLARRYAADA
jgi:sodium/bile acid cotransporter 7